MQGGDSMDQLSELYAELIEDRYDCVDRVVLNAYFSSGQYPAGFRTWWRKLYGSDQNLDTNHLMRRSGRFSRRLRAFAKERNIPVIDCAAQDHKFEISSEFLKTHAGQPGLFLVLVSRAPALVWEVQKTSLGTIANLARKAPMPFVNHYSFHIWDAEWGHVIIKMSGHAPFGAQFILNGHEYVAAQARRNRLAFQKEDNCLVEISDAAHFAKIADTWSEAATEGRWREVCDRWIYSTCLIFWLESGGAGPQWFPLRLLHLPNRIQPELTFPHGLSNGAGLSSADRPQSRSTQPASPQDHLRLPTSAAPKTEVAAHPTLGSHRRETYLGCNHLQSALRQVDLEDL
jgi:hypothetical protein